MAEAFGVSLPLLLVIAGIGLAIAEALAPGAHFIVLGVALILAGLVGLLLGAAIPILAGPIVLALLVLVFGGIALFAYRELDIYGGKGRARTKDSASLKGRLGRVTKPINETGGEVKLERGGFNPYYSARSVDGEIAEGEEVIVVDPGGGNVLTVESLGPVEDEIDRELSRGREAHRRREKERENGDT